MLCTPEYIHQLQSFVASYQAAFDTQAVPLLVSHSGSALPDAIVATLPVTVVETPAKRLGCGQAREKVRPRTEAKWVFYTDADIVFESDAGACIAVATQAAEQDGLAAVQLGFAARNETVWGKFEYLMDKSALENRTPRQSRDKWWISDPTEPDSLPYAAGDLVPICCLQGFGMVIRRDVLDSIGGFDTDLGACEDREIAARLGAAGYRIGYSKRPVVFHDYGFTLKQIVRRKWRHGKFSAVTSRKHLSHYGFGIWPCIKMMLIAAHPPQPYRSLRGRIYFVTQAITFGGSHILHLCNNYLRSGISRLRSR